MMNPFEYEITKARKKPNKVTGSIFSNQIQGETIPHEYDQESLINAYKSWAYICCSKNAVTVASQPLRLYVARDTNSKIRGYKTREIERSELKYLTSNKAGNIASLPAVRKSVKIDEVLDHPFLDLVHSVNPFMNMFELFELLTLHEDLTGNSYWYILDNKLGVPKEIWPIMPQEIKIVPDKNKFISGYKYEKNGLFAKKTGLTLSEKEVIHFKHTSPKSYYYGYSPVWAVKEAYNVGMNVYTYEKALLENGGSLSGTFQTEEELSEFEFERLKLEIKEMFTGAGNAGKAPLLSNGVKYNPYGLQPKEMSFLKGRTSLKEEIANALGQNLAMYSQESNRANSDNAFAEFARNAIRPRLKRIEQKINEKIMPLYDGRLFVAFDNVVPDDVQFKLDERIKHTQFGITSINEERAKLNLDPVPGLEDPIIPVNYQTVETLINQSNPLNPDSQISEGAAKAIFDNK